MYCFITAYGTERMLVLKSKGWRYDKAGFEDVFHPLSDTCPNEKAVSKVAWPGQPDSPAVELGCILQPKSKVTIFQLIFHLHTNITCLLL